MEAVTRRWRARARAGRAGALGLAFLTALVGAPRASVGAEKREPGRVIQERKLPDDTRLKRPEPVPGTGTAPTIKWVRPYDAIDGQPSYDVSYQREVAIDLNRGGGEPTHYRIGESRGATNARWRPYRAFPPIHYTFERDAPGEKTLHLQLKNVFGESPVVSGSIEYRKPPVLERLAIDDGAAVTHEREVTVSWVLSGSADRILLSESPGFADPQQIVLQAGTQGSASFTLSEGHGSKIVYGKLVDSPLPFSKVSNVRQDEIRYEAATEQTHTLTGPALVEFFQLAQSHGFGFTTQRLDGEGECTQSLENGEIQAWYLEARGEPVPLGIPLAPPTLDEPDESALTSSPITCVFNLFVGGALQPGWKMGTVKLKKLPYVPLGVPGCAGWKLVNPVSGSGDLAIGVEGWIGNACVEDAVFARILEITLQGPGDQGWRQAFSP